jgi:hypothetical protein
MNLQGATLTKPLKLLFLSFSPKLKSIFLNWIHSPHPHYHNPKNPRKTLDLYFLVLVLVLGTLLIMKMA